MKYNQDKIIRLYKDGYSLREVADKIGCSMQWVHRVVQNYAPELMRKPYTK